jgi:ribosome-associated heat shock protein Hsp15
MARARGGKGSQALDGDTEGSQERLRIDRCLWHLRLYKTRSLAAAAVGAGRVLLNDVRPKASRDIVVGDRLRVTRESDILEFTVLSIPLRRGPAPEAQACYQETEESIARRAAVREIRALDALSRPQTDGRPDKRDRRLQRDFLRRG